MPNYGYLMESGGAPVGVILLISTMMHYHDTSTRRCNLSSWYVDPEFRNYAALFASMSQKRKDVTYFNVTPATATWPVIEAQGLRL